MYIMLDYFKVLSSFCFLLFNRAWHVFEEMGMARAAGELKRLGYSSEAAQLLKHKS